MDPGVNQNFKQFYRLTFIQKLVNSDCHVHDFQVSINLKDPMCTSALAWKDIKVSTLKKAWRKPCLFPCLQVALQMKNLKASTLKEGLPNMIWLLFQMLQRHYLCHLVQHATVL